MTPAEEERTAIVAWLIDRAKRDDEIAKMHAERGGYVVAAEFGKAAIEARMIASALQDGEHLKDTQA